MSIFPNLISVIPSTHVTNPIKRCRFGRNYTWRVAFLLDINSRIGSCPLGDFRPLKFGSGICTPREQLLRAREVKTAEDFFQVFSIRTCPRKKNGNLLYVVSRPRKDFRGSSSPLQFRFWFIGYFVGRKIPIESCLFEVSIHSVFFMRITFFRKNHRYWHSTLLFLILK
jgi:hypothetical protein